MMNIKGIMTNRSLNSAGTNESPDGYGVDSFAGDSGRGGGGGSINNRDDDGGGSSGADGSNPYQDGSENDDGNNKSKRNEFAIAKQEDKYVRCLRLVVIAVLVVTTVVVAFAVYNYATSTEIDSFTTNYYADAKKVVRELGTSVDLTMTSVDSLAVAFASFSAYTNMTWPNVTLPDFELRAAKTRVLSKAILLNTYYLIQGDESLNITTKQRRLQWEEYAKQNNGWVTRSIELQRDDPHYYGPIVDEPYLIDVIFDYDENPMPPDEPFYLPMWQQSPAIPIFPSYNWDLMSYVDDRSTLRCKDTHQVILAETYHLPDLNDPQAVSDNEVDVEWFSDYVPPGLDPFEPVFDIFYPLLDTTDAITITDPLNQTFVGMIAITIYWKSLLTDILADGTNGIVVVFENECNPTFTYQLNGANVVYLGRGDLHDPKFDDYEVRSRVLLPEGASAYAGVPVDRGFCVHKVRIYPSELMEDQYLTANPTYFTITAVFIFLFTSIIFVIYDWMVERRQRKVMHTATKTSKIVSSLFPTTVQDRLFQTEEFGNKVDDKTEREKRALAFMTGAVDDHQALNGRSEHTTNSVIGDIRRSPPIADLFPNTTIFFADLVGFTRWSSTREPVHVFMLLESLYGAFDKVAKRRRVFKVETIGDCYVAVTGIPKPQEHHATIMVRFARDCMMQLDLLMDELVDVLGEDTRELSMRVGLHSGPTTAGVLRGEKGRFQLFGDTVNTASRMESTGVAGRIHVSQSTANELISKGKGHWLTEREDKIVAKGKGEMVTYFVTSVGTARSIGSSTHYSSHDNTGSSGEDDGGGDDKFFEAWQRSRVQGEQQEQHTQPQEQYLNGDALLGKAGDDVEQGSKQETHTIQVIEEKLKKRLSNFTAAETMEL